MRRLACTLLVLASCGKKPAAPSGTGLSARVDFSTGLGITTIVFEALSDSDPTQVIGPFAQEPSTPSGKLASPYAVDFLLADGLAGTTVRLTAQGVTGSGVVAVGRATAVLVKGKLVPIAVTLAAPTCGDGVVLPPEQCDDGNTTSNDGCSSTCQIESPAVCGNGILELGETCDIGAATSPGCLACVRTAGWTCTASSCSDGSCGNGVVDAGEQCDDANTATGDGCDASCQIEIADLPWTCSGTPSCCQRCGDDKRQCGEACDGTDRTDPANSAITYSCLAIGKLNGGTANKLKCNASCALDSSACGAPISTVANLHTAISEAVAIPGHDIVSIVGNSTTQFAITNIDTPPGTAGPLAIQETGTPDGMTLQPLGYGASGGYTPVTFTTSDTASGIFLLLSGNNVLRGLDFVMKPNTTDAINLGAAARRVPTISLAVPSLSPRRPQ